MKKRIRNHHIFLIPLLICLLATSCQKNKSDDPNHNQNQVENETEEVGITFPYELEDGKITVESLFQSSIDNPDGQNEFVEDLASLEVTNTSGEFCESLSVTVTMLDGEILTFNGKDIPVGSKIWLFSTENKSMDLQEKCDAIEGTASFADQEMMDGQISSTVEDTQITLQNLTNEELKDIKVSCHGLFDEILFGGMTYEYTVESIPAGGKAVIDAVDCYLGGAKVVRITKDN